MNATTRRTISHNTKAWNRAMDKVTAAATGTCPRCAAPALPALLELWGHCMQCQKADTLTKYGV